MDLIDFADIRARNSLVAFCESRGIELHSRGNLKVGVCPFHQEKTGSFYVYGDGHYYCYGCGEHGDVVNLCAALDGITLKEAAEKLSGGVVTESVQHQLKCPACKPAAESPKPDLSKFYAGSPSEFKTLSTLRQVGAAAVARASHMGLLRFGPVCGFSCWILTDCSGICAEARRLDGKKFPAIGDLPERKAHTLRGSKKNWPVGLLPIAEYRDFDLIAVLEGGPDLLAAIHFALEQCCFGVLPAAMLGCANGLRALHPDALDIFRNRRVRIYPHHEQSNVGIVNSLRWADQLLRVGCAVDYFTFENLYRRTGEPVKDLNDCTSIDEFGSARLEALFP